VLGFGLPSRLIVFAVVVALQVARRSAAGSLSTLVALPLLAIVTALLGEVMRHHQAAGDVIVVAAIAGSFALRDAPAPIARVSRLLSLPVVTLFVTPVPASARAGDIGWYLLFSALAGLCALAAARALGGLTARWTLRAAFEDVPRLARAGGASFRRAALELDSRVNPDDAALRQALLETELAATEAPDDLDTALARLASAVAAAPLDDATTAEEAVTPARPSRLRPPPRVRIAIQSGLALAFALPLAQHFFPDHWSWAAVSVLAISGGLRSRGDALLRGGERLLGALAGTFAATLLATSLGSNHVLAVALILALVFAGSLAREATYATYAFCITSALALLYGIYGESGTHLLGERLAENLIGAACVIVPSYFVFPIRTEAVIRRRVADLLAGLSELLATIAEGGEPDAIVRQTRMVDRRQADLDTAVRPLAFHGRTRRLIGREPARAALLAASAGTSNNAARRFVYAALTPEGERDGEALGALRQEVGAQRRGLAGP
jgi:hypothetical protein